MPSTNAANAASGVLGCVPCRDDGQTERKCAASARACAARRYGPSVCMRNCTYNGKPDAKPPELAATVLLD